MSWPDCVDEKINKWRTHFFIIWNIFFQFNWVSTHTSTSGLRLNHKFLIFFWERFSIALTRENWHIYENRNEYRTIYIDFDYKECILKCVIEKRDSISLITAYYDVLRKRNRAHNPIFTILFSAHRRETLKISNNPLVFYLFYFASHSFSIDHFHFRTYIFKLSVWKVLFPLFEFDSIFHSPFCDIIWLSLDSLNTQLM